MPYTRIKHSSTFLRNHYPIDRIAVAGDLISSDPLTVWSELVLFVWGLPQPDSRQAESGRSRYTRPQEIVYQLSDDPRIRLVDASKELTEVELEILNSGSVEL
ncbi:hypothetical protein [Leptodesmis sichuanensis]|uniref:hypothetical protein n=1 Tax=Leptodesmis sichuanensis TaxID=2906798 RepID=UPI001F416B81|nr:hypothetical protein [Leptodesmis sichuanensis]UIE38881.1 hypothetical protein KIK02_04515 [Leptodesmis sichuanensis A121]